VLRPGGLTLRPDTATCPYRPLKHSVRHNPQWAWLSAAKDGEVSERQAIKRLAPSPHWVWGAMAPVGKLILAVDVGGRTLAMAQRLGASGHPGAGAALGPAVSH
jgi:hypothetical protein